ncbi:hypothetical protein AB0I77_52910 [Streptomyces sp. NPDC050619]|uniref:hypothetical protein n=1 Tax=Streptomyces sp. NPDC050619 TaxID=3157214 RepID=UPI003439F478
MTLSWEGEDEDARAARRAAAQKAALQAGRTGEPLRLGNEFSEVRVSRMETRNGSRLLVGHGLTSTGTGVPEAVLRAISVDTIARLCLDVVKAGGTLTDLPEKDLRELPDLGGSFNNDTAWRHEMARLG